MHMLKIPFRCYMYAKHWICNILISHRQRDDDNTPEGGDTAMRVKYDLRLHGARAPGALEPLTTAFLQKYIQYAKNRYKCARRPPLWTHTVGLILS